MPRERPRLLWLRLLVGAIFCYLLAVTLRGGPSPIFLVFLVAAALFEVGFWIELFRPSEKKLLDRASDSAKPGE